MPLPNKVSESTRRLNPELFGATQFTTQGIVEPAKPRLRQKRGPKTNKTEAAFAVWLSAKFPDLEAKREGVTLLLCNGVRYTADFAIFNPGGDLVLYEVKGPHAWDDAIVKLKVAASVFPRVSFWLASPADRQKLTWRLERVCP